MGFGYLTPGAEQDNRGLRPLAKPSADLKAVHIGTDEFPDYRVVINNHDTGFRHVTLTFPVPALPGAVTPQY